MNSWGSPFHPFQPAENIRRNYTPSCVHCRACQLYTVPGRSRDFCRRCLRRARYSLPCSSIRAARDSNFENFACPLCEDPIFLAQHHRTAPEQAGWTSYILKALRSTFAKCSGVPDRKVRTCSERRRGQQHDIFMCRAAIVPVAAPHVRRPPGRVVFRFSCLQDVTMFFRVVPSFFSRYS